MSPRAVQAVGAAWLMWTAWEIRNSRTGQDIGRQWLVAQYARQGVDPYRVSLNALHDVQGEGAPKRVPTIPQQLADPVRAGVLPGHDVPESTYPPFATGLLSVTFGLLPKAWVLWVWTALNAGIALMLPALLRRACGLAPHSGLLALALVLLWPPIQATLYWGQFGLVVFAAALLGTGTRPDRQIRSGLWLSLVLLKPSLGLPFLMVPLVRGRWIALLAVAVVHVAGTVLLSLFVHVAPWTLIREWVSVSSYFLGRGMYTLEELLGPIVPANSTGGSLVTLGAIVIAFLWLWRHRRRTTAAILCFVACVSVAWMYHVRYDFVVLLVPLFVLAFGQVPDPRGQPLPPWLRGALILALVLVGVSLLAPVYGGDEAVFRALRWAGRISFAGILLASAAYLAWGGAGAATIPNVGGHSR
jgi:hypothetical protein